MPVEPTFEYEEQYWKQNITVAGVDEAGMGALAGPVVAGAVIFQPGSNDQFPMTNDQSNPNTQRQKIQIRDSKTLSEKQRGRAREWIIENAVAWALGEATVEEIDQLNIRNAAHLAMRRAVDSLATTPDVLLIDGTPAQPHESVPAVNLVDGDALSFSIAAASIVAKTHRDALLLALDEKFPAYGLASHKGYGSAAHLTALREHGASPHHRHSYAPVARVVAGL